MLRKDVIRKDVIRKDVHVQLERHSAIILGKDVIRKDVSAFAGRRWRDIILGRRHTRETSY